MKALNLRLQSFRFLTRKNFVLYLEKTPETLIDLVKRQRGERKKNIDLCFLFLLVGL